METGIRGDLEWGTTPRLVRSAAERFGSSDALVDGDVRLTFAELAGAVTDAGRAFVAAGVEAGDRVAIWAPNVWEWVVALLGLQSVGGVVVPINTRYKGAEAAYLLQRSRARILVTVNGFLGNDQLAMLEGHDLPHLEATVVLRGDVPSGAMGWDDFMAAGAPVPTAEVDRRVDAVTAEDVSDILFTSGTTGDPKGAVCTHGQVVRAFADWAAVVGLRHGDRYLVINPFFHSFGYKVGIIACLVTGATILRPVRGVAWGRERFANYKVPAAVHVVSTLPTNPAGKVLKVELRSQLSRP